MLEDLRLDPETGFLFWTGGARKGRRAGSVDKYGYRQIGLEGRVLREHRVVWRIFHGAWPVGSLDHINGNRQDNRPINLRESDPVSQMQNRAMPISNTSGVQGVTKHKATGRWQAFIQAKGKFIHLGLFSEISDAAKARRDAEIKFGFHQNHGRKAPVSQIKHAISSPDEP